MRTASKAYSPQELSLNFPPGAGFRLPLFGIRTNLFPESPFDEALSFCVFFPVERVERFTALTSLETRFSTGRNRSPQYIRLIGTHSVATMDDSRLPCTRSHQYECGLDVLGHSLSGLSAGGVRSGHRQVLCNRTAGGKLSCFSCLADPLCLHQDLRSDARERL